MKTLTIPEYYDTTIVTLNPVMLEISPIMNMSREKILKNLQFIY